MIPAEGSKAHVLPHVANPTPPAEIDRTIEAIIIDCPLETLPSDDVTAILAATTRQLESLTAHGVHIFVVCSASSDYAAAWFAARPAGPGRLFVCHTSAAEAVEVADDGVRSTTHIAEGLYGAATFATQWLAQRGITGELILVSSNAANGTPRCNDPLCVPELSRATTLPARHDHESKSHEAHLRDQLAMLGVALDAQLRRRSDQRVPNIDADPAWVLPLPADHKRARVAESLGVLANGLAGVRGTVEEDGFGTTPLFLAGGVYGRDDHLVPGPIWTGLGVHLDRRRHDRRSVDLRTGVLVRDESVTGFRSIRLLSADDPHAMALRAEAPPGVIDPGDPILAPRDDVTFETVLRGDVRIGMTGLEPDHLVVAAHDVIRETRDRHVVERIATWSIEPAAHGGDTAIQHLAAARERGFARLLAAHRAAWAARWEDALVEIDDSPEDELAARFAVFHLLSAAGNANASAVGARGLTGDAYGGHVFWDADVFVLPALAAINPAAARTMLEYRILGLPAAREAALEGGHVGARFPWESGRGGRDVTPREVKGTHGEIITIETGPHEEHIVADVAWAADRYASWTADASFLVGPGAGLIVETARYWASRIEEDTKGRGHLKAVMGPDEYHEVVDDNAYTNVMVRWNLRRGAALLSRRSASRAERSEATEWVRLATSLVSGWSPERGVYEQFAGFFELDPLLVADIAEPPVAIDVLLGATRVASSQLIKQADVLMLHHLLPDEVVPRSLGPCLDFYEPRTAHGSSLSPAISASLHARAGRPERALELFRMAAQLDLDDLTGTTAGGLHLATMGGLWQALAYGFLGLHANGEVLGVTPCLPSAWSALSLQFRFRGRRVRVRAQHDKVTVSTDAPISVRIGGRRAVRCVPPGRTFSYDAGPGKGD